MASDLMQCKACDGQSAQHDSSCVHHEPQVPWYRQAGLATTLAFFGVAAAAMVLRLT